MKGGVGGLWFDARIEPQTANPAFHLAHRTRQATNTPVYYLAAPIIPPGVTLVCPVSRALFWGSLPRSFSSPAVELPPLPRRPTSFRRFRRSSRSLAASRLPPLRRPRRTGGRRTG